MIELGSPIPDSPHAVSVSLPTIASVIGYEENNPDVVSRLRGGYPRFVLNDFVKKLFTNAQEKFGADREFTMVFPNESAAKWCADYIYKKTNMEGRMTPYGYANLTAVSFPSEAKTTCLFYWRITGQIVSSRLAEAALSDKVISNDSTAIQKIKERIADDRADQNDVYLFETGMSAIFAVYKALIEITPNKKTAQLGFPYVDTLKVEQEFGSGVVELLDADESPRELEKVLKSEKLAGVFTEVPSNPLLKTADLKSVKTLCERNNIPLVIDDTIDASHNNIMEFADVAVTSLTKFFSGKGDVMAGAVTLNKNSAFYKDLKEKFDAYREDLLWGEDAVALEENSRYFESRMRIIDSNALVLHEFLKTHPKVESVWYSGYSGLISFLLKEADQTTATFFDNLDVAKGPSLGTNFTLACPYTLLAHYTEQDWAKQNGIDKYLIRVSVGLENINDLTRKFQVALDNI